ncbi:Mitogen-activated protein kinase kinase kinase [Trema orientale]|uniref:Mitogen-activated protein kinase kinase kinase n=1 Tax=Trema orientale TaxID=63057 RepID=A0A2P5CYL1_TREOI|nr:Mitogen-activated protein kinase kinase kinase [Trema orientale]
MNSEVPGTSGQFFCKGTGNVVSGDRAAVKRNANNISLQTGEEFSAEFMQDPAALRRLTPVITNVNHRSPKRVGFNLNTTNHEPVYEDRIGIFGPRRMDHEYNPEVSDFGSSPAFVAEVDHKVYPNNISRYHWEYGAAGQVSSGRIGDELNRDRISAGPTTPHHYGVESPQSYNPFVTGFSEGSNSGKVKFLCSFGGRISQRPNDGKHKYVGGDTRILSIRRNITWEELVKKTSAICNQAHTIKYQLPGEDLDSLISVCSDEDLHNLFEEYQELERTGGSQRLRIFLVSLHESESPSSAEARPMQANNGDYQYVVAVNGMLEPSPQKSSSGQSLTSQSSQFGNNSDYSPSFCRGSPTSAYTLENKDCISPSSSNLVGLFTRPVSQFPPRLLPSKSFNQLTSMSPFQVQHMDPENSNLHYYMDQPYVAGNGDGNNPFVVGKFPCQDSNCVDPMGYYYHGHSQMNYHPYNKYLMDSEQPSRPQQMGFHQRSRSGDFESSQLNVQSGMKSWRPMLKDGNFYCDSSFSYPEDSLDLSSASNDKDGYRNKMMHALSDSKLQELDHRSSDGGITLPLLNIEQGKLHLASGSSKGSPTHQEKIANRMPQAEQHEIQVSDREQHYYKGRQGEEMMSWTNRNKANDNQYKTEFGDNLEVSSYAKTAEVSDSSNINYVRIPAEVVAPLPVNALEGSADTMRQSSDQVQFCSTVKRISSQPVLDGSRGLLPMDSQEYGGEESFFQSSKSDSTLDSDREASLLEKDHEIGNLSLSREFHERPKLDDALSIHSIESYHDNKATKSVAVIIEDVTHGISHEIPSSSNVVLYVEDEVTDEPKSLKEGEGESAESDGEDEDGSDADRNNSMSDAAIAEIEAGIYGLQIIKHSDLEELQELGSGTFGTVYHGKWRGTDVAIKRIKKSCFSGRSSEQERLIKDFWREARILSTLHHPNVVAFYGVVPDGPGGTLATVTEFMVNGSLRHVLLKKDRVLDRRKRLRIAMDAAFGMEYLHLKNIVHFDLKCDNLLVNLRDPERPICKVGDFGLSRIKRNTLVSGGVRGTLPWMAPELLNGSSSRVSEKVDVFSFGIVMWEILTGEEPYADMHCGAIIGGIVNNTLRPAIPKRCDSEWKMLMEECWSADPEARPSFTDITDRLRDMSTALQKNKRQDPSTR